MTFGERQGREKRRKSKKKKYNIQINTHFLTSVAQKQAKEKKSQAHDCNKVKGEKQRRERATLPYLGRSCGRETD